MITAMQKRLLFIAILLLAICQRVAAEDQMPDRITIGDFSIYSGQSKEVSITLDNAEPYVGFQFDLLLPTGFTIVGNPTASNRIPEGTTLQMAQQSDGSYRFIAAALTGKAIDGNSGEIIRFTITNDEEMVTVGGEFTASLYNIKLSKPDGTGTFPETQSFSIAVKGDEPYAALSDDNTVLTFYYDKKKEERNGMSIGPFSQTFDQQRPNGYRITSNRPWEDVAMLIEKIVFDDSFAQCDTITSTSHWFLGFLKLTEIVGIENLRTLHVTEMISMFGGCSSLTSLDLRTFDTSNVTGMQCMFMDCRNLRSINLSSFNTSKVMYMQSLFQDCSSLETLDITNFDTSNVLYTGSMFNGCSSLSSIDLSHFNTTNLSVMAYMFQNCSSLTSLDLSNFDISKVVWMKSMFNGCSNLKTIYVVNEWNLQNVTEGDGVFSNCTHLVGGRGTTYDENRIDYTFAHIDGGTSNPGYFTDKNATVVTNPEPYAVLSEDNTVLTFYYDDQKEARNGMDVGSFSDINQRGWHEQRGNITKVVFDDSFADCYTLTSTASWFAECENLATIENLNLLKTANVTNMHEMFYGCSSLTSIDLSSFNTANVTDMGGMFHGLSNVTTLDLSGFNTSSVTSMERMFFDSGLTSLDVSSFNTTNVTNMVAMFHGVQVENLNLSNFDTRNVTTMEWMFASCYVLRTLNISNFNTEKVQNMYGMFSECGSLTSLDVSNFNTQNVTNMGQMFRTVGGETLDISNFNTENVTNMDGMFQYSGLVTIYVGEGWNTDKLEDNGGGMFNDCTRLVGGKGTIYDPNHTDVSYAHIDGGPSNPGYFTDKNAPEITATFDGVTLTVVGQTTMAQALEQVGGRDVVAKDIAAIVWNSTEAITRSDIEGFGNPNLLIYVQTESLAPEGVNNVVVDGKAKNIVLVDADGNNNFYAPQAFTAEEISYTRNFQQQTQVGVSRGWEGICLPFTVESYTHENHGTIAPFHNNASNYHFWLHQMTDQGMDNATTIEANKPYIISMPNSDAYPEAYNQAGKVTFAASNATVPASDNSAYWSPDGSIALMSTYLRIEPSEFIHALNVGQEMDGYVEGSVFVRNYREVRPFEAYTFHEQSNGARYISLSSLFGGEGTTDIIDVIAEPSGDRWYDMNGRRLQSKPVRKGIYIKNGKKIVVK